ncbi:MAG: thioredoxin [Flavobacteriaceae bacterium CG18_big_fil_WC_8_21_14_2_50_34_36]|nr:rhodanese-like domain-containing protein [Flavobacteriia bacterium]PIQ17334.1 MAG: thioredoxin [Flavobacteriaceae bacterium CG18_big_fil_WC_8_21_14_2_50_34_36]PIV49333.1 MAG: rhodanese-like domain-containing protein [Flavobacteriaceae bacterium CG02_land_8_20_14_3_00_34_13]PJC08176.1 MAG: rhodanese-like domain-containing protein [Flavobacteriaceae bacterium CG_4_9_14_0_8_um_filter_34_30]
MKHIYYYLFFLISLLISCNDSQNKSIQNITPEQMQDALLEENIQVLDVRTPEEFNESFIKKSQNICVTQDDFKEKVKQLDKNKPVYLYCKSGIRSAKAAKILKEMGFKEIYTMQGGVDLWKEKGFELDKS